MLSDPDLDALDSSEDDGDDDHDEDESDDDKTWSDESDDGYLDQDLKGFILADSDESCLETDSDYGEEEENEPQGKFYY